MTRARAELEQEGSTSAGDHPPPERGPVARAAHGCTTGQHPNGGAEAGTAPGPCDTGARAAQSPSPRRTEGPAALARTPTGPGSSHGRTTTPALASRTPPHHKPGRKHKPHPSAKTADQHSWGHKARPRPQCHGHEGGTAITSTTRNPARRTRSRPRSEPHYTTARRNRTRHSSRGGRPPGPPLGRRPRTALCRARERVVPHEAFPSSSALRRRAIPGPH